MTKRSLTLALATSLAACGSDTGGPGDGASGVTVRDSAGIRIVENHDSVWTGETRWRLAEEPDFVIGSFDGSVPGTDFGEIIQAKAWGDDVVVSDLMSVSLRLFDDSGAFVEEIARRGDGPTELSDAGQWQIVGRDTLVVGGVTKTVVFDRGTGSASSYRPEDPPVDAEAFEGLGPSFAWLVRAWFPDGSYVMMNSADPRDAEPGFETKHLHAERMLPGGEYAGPLGRLAMQRFYTSPGGDPVPVSLQTIGHLATEGMHLWHAFADSLFEIRRIDAGTGRVDRLLRLSVPPGRVDEEMTARLREFEDQQIEWAMEQMGGDVSAEMREGMDRRLAEMREAQPTGYFAPFVFGLRPMHSGHLLVDLPDWEWRFDANQLLTGGVPVEARMAFAVFDPDGRWLGTFEGPEGLAVTDVTDDYVVGFRRDEFGVPYVERWRIIKP